MVLVDTSALFALLDPDDAHHGPAAAFFADAASDTALVTHNYVVVEASALVRARLGAAASRALLSELVPVLEIAWIDEELHRAATSALLAAPRRQISLVDWTSFEIMRRRDIAVAFAFDRDFSAQGFRLLP